MEEIKKTAEEIQAMADKAKDIPGLAGMTYQEGVTAALEWVLGYMTDEDLF